MYPKTQKKKNKKIKNEKGDLYRRLAITTISMIFIFPATLFRDISALEKLSAFSVFTVIIIMTVVMWKFVWIRLTGHFLSDIPGSNRGIMPEITWFDVNGTLPALGIVAFAFVCHDKFCVQYVYFLYQKCWTFFDFFFLRNFAICLT